MKRFWYFSKIFQQFKTLEESFTKNYYIHYNKCYKKNDYIYYKKCTDGLKKKKPGW